MSQSLAILTAALAAMILVAEHAVASDPFPPDVEDQAGTLERAEVPPPIIRRETRVPHVERPALGAGYVPYRYPAVDTCPCGDAGCYHPGWYYCGGKSYRRAWWRRWAGAHLGHGSLLDAYPCHCVLPTFGRAVRFNPAAGVSPDSEPAVPAVPADAAPID